MAPDQADVLARGAAAAARARIAVAVGDFAAAAARARVRAAAHVGVAALARLRAAKVVAQLLEAFVASLPPWLRPARDVLKARNECRAGRRQWRRGRRCDTEDCGRDEQQREEVAPHFVLMTACKTLAAPLTASPNLRPADQRRPFSSQFRHTRLEEQADRQKNGSHALRY